MAALGAAASIRSTGTAAIGRSPSALHLCPARLTRLPGPLPAY
jgi:hypothetical protein